MKPHSRGLPPLFPSTVGFPIYFIHIIFLELSLVEPDRLVLKKLITALLRRWNYLFPIGQIYMIGARAARPGIDGEDDLIALIQFTEFDFSQPALMKENFFALIGLDEAIALAAIDGFDSAFIHSPSHALQIWMSSHPAQGRI